MCQSNAYIMKDDKEEMILSDIISIKPRGTQLCLTNLFGEEEIVEASIEEWIFLITRSSLSPGDHPRFRGRKN